MIDIGKKNFLRFSCLKICSFFAFAFKVCKKCYYDPNNFFVQYNNMGIKKTQTVMLISNLLMPAVKNAPKKLKVKKPGKNPKKTLH
jgi:hypothetical protein